MGGNIGVPVLALEPFAPGRAYVLEVSSYQIDLAPSLKPTVGILLNVSEDHLDRHGSMENYAALKTLLLACVEPGGTAVIGVDDRYTARRRRSHRARRQKVVRVSVLAPLRDGFYAQIGDRQPHPARRRRQGARGGAARRHRQLARRAQCAERGLRHRRLSRARSRTAGDPEGAGEFPRSRASHAAGGG